VTWILGFHGGVKQREMEDSSIGYSSHDAAAVLLKDDEVVAAIEEERLNRVKHSNNFPVQAIRFCLKHAGITVDDVDIIVTDVLEESVDNFVRFEALVHPELPLQSGRLWIEALFKHEFGCSGIGQRLRFCQHHLAHINGAIYSSGFDRGLAVSLDGEGDGLSGMVGVFDGASFSTLKKYRPDQSLGNFYTSTIALLGYRRFDEYKVMGLAPYGNASTFAEMFQGCYRLLPDGDIEIASDAEKLSLAARCGLLDHVRRKGQPFTQVHMDFAAGLQESLERMGTHIFTHFQKISGEQNLIFSGGVAHNCTMNGKILYANLFEKMFVQPLAHDAGNALGAAFSVLATEGKLSRTRKLTNLFLGGDGAGNAEQQLQQWGALVEWSTESDIVRTTARLLADGAVIGWFQGRSEFGPRALGNRSILADPRPAENKNRINAMIKMREGYRPFAPSVLEDRLRDFFEVPEGHEEFPFMIYVLKVREAMRSQLGAVTHVDGTARVQTVSKEGNPVYYKLISEFGQLTGIPILLNTSFNNDVEPIVESAEDAIACYLTTGLDYLVIGNCLVRRRTYDAAGPIDGSMRAQLSPSRKLVQYGTENVRHTGPAFAIESIFGSYFSPQSIKISQNAYRILSVQDQTSGLHARCREVGLDEGGWAGLAQEMVHLWQKRAIALKPGF